MTATTIGRRTVPERIQRTCMSLARCYPALFDTAELEGSQGARERSSNKRADPPLPIRVDVLDLIREINQIVLELQAVCAAALGLGARPVPDVGYRNSHLVPEALAWLHRAAGQLDDAGIGDHVLAVLAGDSDQDGLLRAARRLLGLSEHTLILTCPCPQLLDTDEGEVGGRPCGGALLAIPGRGLILCRSCGQRWDEQWGDWQTLGRIVRAEITQEAA